MYSLRSEQSELASCGLHTHNERETLPASSPLEIHQRKPNRLPSSLCKPSLRTYFDWDDTGNDDYAARPTLLDLFCGGGGAAFGYYLAGFRVVGVDINPQPHYPFEFHQADALTYPLEGFDAYHASPPCQANTKKSATWGRKRTYWYDHKDIIPQVRELLAASGKPFVIENVNGAKLDGTLMLCGTMFGLRIIKHRYFEFNWDMPINAPFTCNHSDVYNPWSGNGRNAEKLREAMGIDWLPISGGASRKAGYTGDLSNAIPPAYTQYIGQYLLGAIKELQEGE